MGGTRTATPPTAWTGELRGSATAAQRWLLSLLRREPTRGGQERRVAGDPHGGGSGTLRPSTLSPHAVPSLPLLGSGHVPTEAPGEASARSPPSPLRAGMVWPRGAGIGTSGSPKKTELQRKVVLFQREPGGGGSRAPFSPRERVGGPSPKALGMRRGPPGKPRFQASAAGPPLPYSGRAAGPGAA